MTVEKSDNLSELPRESLRKLSDYETLTSKVLSLVAKDTRFECHPPLDRVLADNKRLIVVFSHASPLSWIPAPCLLTSHVAARGGGGRSPIAVMDRFFYSIPGLKQIAEYITQSSEPLGFAELVRHFEKLETADLVVFPEGSNCFFGESQNIQPFRSARFAEIAMMTSTPLLLCVHRGSENWGKTFSVDSSWLDRVPLPKVARGFLETRLKDNGVLTIPKFPAPMPLFQMSCELYVPERRHLSEEPETRRRQVLEESEKIHLKMEAMLLELDEQIKDQI